MKKLWNRLNGTGLGRAVQSYVKVFLTVVLGLFLADGANVFEIDASDVKLWLAAGLSSVLPLVLTALNPKDARFGIKPNLLAGVDPSKVNIASAFVEKKPELINPLLEIKKPAAKKAATKKVSE
jgi:hypothetical protein